MADSDQISSSIIEILRRHAKAGQDVNGATNLVADLGLDSVQVMELLTDIEDRFDVSIPLNLLPDIRSVDDLCARIHRLIAEQS